MRGGEEEISGERSVEEWNERRGRREKLRGGRKEDRGVKRG